MTFTGRILTLDPTGFWALAMPNVPVPALAGMLALLAWDLGTEARGNVRFYASWPLPLRAALYEVAIYLLAFGATTTPSAFIYFQF